MRDYRRADRSTVIVISLVVLSFLLMTFDIRARGEGIGGTLRNGAQSVFAPVQGLLTTMINPVVDLVDGIANLAGLREENARLREQLEDLNTQVARVEELEQQVGLLEELANLQLERDDLAQTAANVVGAGDSLDLAFTIDKGVADGVLVGNPVIDTSGNAVGTVVEVFETKAKVLPVIARTEGTGVRAGEQRGVLLGLGREDELQLEILDATAVVRSELLLLTEAGKFPPGLPVAVVMESAGPEAGQIRALAEPTADFTRLRIVVVLGWPLPEEPAAPAVTTTVPAATTTTGDQGSGG